MNRKITKGMILAAGLGTRLRPITLETPKPLIKVGERGVIEYSLMLFARSGVKEIVVNLHHLGDKIKTFLGDGSRYGVSLTYSYEPEILGTGGGIKKVEDFFRKEPFVVINGDVITNIDLKKVFDFHLCRKDIDATLVLQSLSNGEKYTPIRVQDNNLVEYGNGDKMYTGIQVLEASALDMIPPNRFSNIVTDCYIPLLKQGRKIGAYTFDGFWTEIGTLDRLNSARDSLKNTPLWYL